MLHEIIGDPEFWVLVAFVIAVGALARKAAPIISGSLDERAAKIKAELEEAQHLREEAQALLAEHQKKQREALAEAEEILRHAAEEAARNRQQGAADIAAALKRREQQALDRIAQAEAKALDEIRELAVDLAVAATRTLLKDNLDAGRAASLVDQAIAELPERLH